MMVDITLHPKEKKYYLPEDTEGANVAKGIDSQEADRCQVILQEFSSELQTNFLGIHKTSELLGEYKKTINTLGTCIYRDVVKTQNDYGRIKKIKA